MSVSFFVLIIVKLNVGLGGKMEKRMGRKNEIKEQWISVSDRLPKLVKNVFEEPFDDISDMDLMESDEVLVFVNEKNGLIKIASLDGNGDWSDREGGLINRSKLTHWMKLPKKPIIINI